MRKTRFSAFEAQAESGEAGEGGGVGGKDGHAVAGALVASASLVWRCSIDTGRLVQSLMMACYKGRQIAGTGDAPV